MKKNSNVRTISIRELRKMIKEEADGLAAGHPEDVSAKEEPWEEEEGVKVVDQLAAQQVKKEARIRRLKVEAMRLSRRLRECRRLIRGHEQSLAEAVARRRSMRRRRRRV